MPAKILVIDDEESMCNFMEIMLSKEGYQVSSVNGGPDGIKLLKEENYDLVIADMNMPEMTGIEVLKEIKTFKQEQELIVMTAYASVDNAIEAMKQGAADYVTKPFKVDEIKLVIEKVINRKRLEIENDNLKKQLQDSNAFDNFIGMSDVIVQMKKMAKRISSSDSTVMIRGESGVGKDLIARAIHHHSTRCNGPFVTINCAALPENLLESELFGYKKGAFTGAIKDKDGLFRAADGGTFFLDEIGNTSLSIQVKLLRTLEDKIITPVGDTKPITVDVRLIAATNANLEDDVRDGRFRADLFYRLNVIPIDVPPLRERTDDIRLLTEYFVAKYCGRIKTETKEISAEVMNILTSYPWPGNVRELENTIERAVLLNRTDSLELEDLPEKLIHPVIEPSAVNSVDPATPTLESIEKAYIHYIMSQTNGKKSEAAKLLGIDASTLYRKIERYRLSDDHFDEKAKKSTNSQKTNQK